VADSNFASQTMACWRELPHITAEGIRDAHTAGRCGCPKILQRCALSSCTQHTPAGLPRGMPGMGELIEGAVQQAPQRGRHNMRTC
jgi:hypothetical protein